MIAADGESRGYLVPDTHTKPIGEPGAQYDRIPALKIVERTAENGIGDNGLGLQVALPNASHGSAGRHTIGGQHRLPLDLRGDTENPGHRSDLYRQSVEVLNGSDVRVDRRVTVETEDPACQFQTEPVHHAHHDDQSGNAWANAQKREARDNGNEPFRLRDRR